MKLLTATALTQGERDNDYHWCVEGELLRFDTVCARGAREPDGGCGCGRGFAGLNSMRATTTALVRDVELDVRDVRVALAASVHAAGYLDDADDLDAVAAEVEVRLHTPRAGGERGPRWLGAQGDERRLPTGSGFG